MSETLEIYPPVVVAKLQQDGLNVSVWGVLCAVLLGAYSIWLIVVADRMIKLPIAMEEEVPDRKARIDIFIKDTRRLLIESYKKVR